MGLLKRELIEKDRGYWRTGALLERSLREKCLSKRLLQKGLIREKNV